MGIIYYAPGNTWGHVNRANCLLTRTNKKSIVFTNSYVVPYYGWKAYNPIMPIHSQPTRLYHNTLPSSGAYVREFERLQHEGFDTLIVDTYPLGENAELEAVLKKSTMKKVYVARQFDENWLNKIKDKINAYYDLVIVPGPYENQNLDWCSKARYTNYWTEFTHKELSENLPVPQISKALLLVSGTEAEHRTWLEYRSYLNLRNIQSDIHSDLWGLGRSQHEHSMQLMLRYPVVIGGGGYNTVAECYSTMTPLLSVPIKRKYESQEQRVRSHIGARRSNWYVDIYMRNDPDHLRDMASEIKRLIRDGREYREIPYYENGAQTAINLIELIKV